MSAPAVGRNVLRSLEAGIEREWLATNGLGGYASGTVAGPNTRRYHGLLVAALRPPVDRRVLVARCDAVAEYRGRRYALSASEYGDGLVHPDGWRHLESFGLEGTIPVWRWRLADAVLEQRVWMEHGRNTSYVAWQLASGGAGLRLELSPLCTGRDYHWHSRGQRPVAVSAVDAGVELSGWPDALQFRILAERAECRPEPDWFWDFRHRAEGERGLDEHEDLFRPAVFTAALEPGGECALALTVEPTRPRGAAEALAAERARQAGLLAAANLPESAPAWVRQLVLAADQFVVSRRLGDVEGSSVIAGYPWFSDWGRDTMIALPGLALATGRPEEARRVLRTFAAFVSDGMLPNRFPDAGEEPEYNTVDATLWYFVAVEEYLRRRPDPALRDELYPVLADIARWHLQGTRYGIQADPADGLLRAGEPGVQLTWMDAKVGDWVVTPRIGKPVEINALWINALAVLAGLAGETGDREAAREWSGLAERASRSFTDSFWYEEGGYLYDVVGGPEGQPGPDGVNRDARLRPNQLIAVSLRHSPLDPTRARSVVDACGRELWTPVGLRSLAPGDPAYTGRYGGGPRERDAAYHQGTAWSWLLGPYACAHYRTHGNRSAALGCLEGIADHLRDACLGQVSEIFDADPPHAPRGCYAQAWGVAEVLRAWREIHDASNEQTRDDGIVVLPRPATA